MALRHLLKRGLAKVKRWIDSADQAESLSSAPPLPPFDNAYPWLNASFAKLMANPGCSQRPQYVWGILQGAALAKVLGMQRICVVEFGVACGAGLIAMEHAAEECEQLVDLRIEVWGFDTGTGIPKPKDYRDMPYRWSEGYYPCDKEKLQRRLRRGRVHFGLVDQTVTEFVQSNPPPVAFVAVDLCLHSSTREALRLFAADNRLLLPRTPCSFRSSVGKDNCRYTGELLAISEFNTLHDRRKICKIEGLNYFVPAQFDGHWTQMLYMMHSFDHPHYGKSQSYRQSALIDIDGREIFVEPQTGVGQNTENRWMGERSQ